MDLAILAAWQHRAAGGGERACGCGRPHGVCLGRGRCRGSLAGRGAGDRAQHRRCGCQEPGTGIVGRPLRHLQGRRAPLAATDGERAGRGAARQQDGKADDQPSAEPVQALCPHDARHVGSSAAAGRRRPAPSSRPQMAPMQQMIKGRLGAGSRGQSGSSAPRLRPPLMPDGAGARRAVARDRAAAGRPSARAFPSCRAAGRRPKRGGGHPCSCDREEDPP